MIKRRMWALLLATVLFGHVWGYTAVVETEAGVQPSEQDRMLQAEETPGEEIPGLFLISLENDAGMTALDEVGTYYFREYLTVKLAIGKEEEAIDLGESDAADEAFVMLKRNNEIIAVLPAGHGQWTDVIEEEGIYEYTLQDEAGNVSDLALEIAAAKAAEEPEFTVRFPDEAVKVGETYYFRDVPKMTGDIDGTVGIARIECKKGEGDYRELVDYQENGIYRSDEHVSYSVNLDDVDLDEQEENWVDGVYTYTLRVTNAVGGVTEVPLSFHVDRTPPDPQVFVSYKTDFSEADSSYAGEVVEFTGADLDRLFGQQKIAFDLYVRDSVPEGIEETEVSGIDEETLQNSLTWKAGLIRIEEAAGESGTGQAAFTFQGTTYTGYRRIRGTVTLPEGDEISKDRIVIEELKDRAGNVLGGITPVNITGTTILYLDRAAPVLSLEYGDDVNVDEDGERLFYRDSADVRLALHEDFYKAQTDREGEALAPEITVVGQEESKETTWIAGEDAVWTQLEFPKAAGQEAVYGFRVTYTDGSGNALVTDGSGKGSVDAGIFTNYQIVVDDRAPVLVNYRVEGVSEREIDGKKVFRNMDGDDAVICLSMQDHADYWNPANLTLTLVNENTGMIVETINGAELIWEHEGDLHRLEYGFDGEENEEAAYRCLVSYKDRAGNPLIKGSNVIGGYIEEDSAAAYVSDPFILDHAAPRVTITYNDAVRLVKDGVDFAETEEKIPKMGYVSYYNEKIRIVVSVEDFYGILEMDEDGKAEGLKDFTFTVSKDGVTYPAAALSWRLDEERRRYIGVCEICRDEKTAKTDGDYVITASYWDAAGNEMTAGDLAEFSELEAVQGDLTGGTYRSPVLVLDTTAPALFIEYTEEPQRKNAGRSYFSSDTTLRITVEDRNARMRELKNGLAGFTAVDSQRTEIAEGAGEIETVIAALRETDTARETLQVELPLCTEANYSIPVSFTDLAGNKAIWAEENGRVTDREVGQHTECVTIDKTAPMFEMTGRINETTFADAINYKDSGFWFAGQKISIAVHGEDSVAGIQKMTFEVTDEAGRKHTYTKEVQPMAAGTYETEIPLVGKDFKGTVKAIVTDWCGNTADSDRGSVVESGAMHDVVGSAVITTLTPPGRTVDGVDYYRSDVELNLLLQDSYSGLSGYHYKVGSQEESGDYAKEAGYGFDGDAKQTITYELERNLILEAASNNKNDVTVSADFVDNAGHITRVEKRYNIDITAPAITVDYDLNDPANGKYYKAARTATVTIQERNFDARDVEFLITNTDGIMPSIGEWSRSGSGDHTYHTCSVIFEADGDYTFSVAFQDLAGNWASYRNVDEFTIDKTEPKITVRYDTYDCRNKYYYAKARTATIDIEEHNFDSRFVDVIITAKEGAAQIPAVSGWTRSGDHNIAHVTFGEDGRYTLDIIGMDLAENILPEYETDQFVIDQTAPQLEILGVRDRSANNGEVRPTIRYADQNPDPAGPVICITGARNGVWEAVGTQTWVNGGQELVLDDFAYLPEMDDMYRMETAVCDLAGNRSQANILFSVNRFGSVYDFDAATESLVGENGSYYTTRGQELMITETNVDTLEFREITCNVNGNLRTLKEGTDYMVVENGSEESWKQYTYILKQSNFQEEGTYLLTIYSEDRAANASDNNTKKKKIAFAVDKTGPSIVVSGVKHEAQYRENSRQITLDVQDNIRLSDVKVVVDGKKMVYSAEDVARMDGRISFRVGSANHWQSMIITAYDAAGNEQSTEEIKFLITANIFVQFFMNKPLFFGGLGALFTGSCWTGFIIWKKWKHKAGN